MPYRRPWKLAVLLLVVASLAVLTACGGSATDRTPSGEGDAWDELTWDEGRWA